MYFYYLLFFTYFTIHFQLVHSYGKPFVRFFSVTFLASVYLQDYGGYNDVDPPLPIPNREVKHVCADGTALPGGRVGSRRPYKRGPAHLFVLALFFMATYSSTWVGTDEQASAEEFTHSAER